MSICRAWRSLLAVCCMGLLAQGVQAQTDSPAGEPENETMITDATVAEAGRNDSLTLLVNSMQSRMNDAERSAEQERKWRRKRFFNISYAPVHKLTNDDAGLEWSKDFAVGLTMGRTYYLHRKPVAGMVKFGIDWAYLDFTYARYKYADDISGSDPTWHDGSDGHIGYDTYLYDLGMHSIDYCMHVGPSVTVNPVSHLMVNAYFHYLPTASAALLDGDFSFGFVNGMAFGMSVSWKVIAVGFEKRWGSGKYSKFGTSDDLEYGGGNDEVADIYSERTKMKQNSFRVFVGFRF